MMFTGDGLCDTDVSGICFFDSVSSGCYPRSLMVVLIAVWSTSVSLWLWAAWVMVARPFTRPAVTEKNSNNV
jgi:hypothetical protein